MTKPTHTHKTDGGRFVEVGLHDGAGPLEGQRLVIYHDLDKDVTSATTKDDWRQHWRTVDLDTCTVCMGTGTDQIKGNREKPCGGCYGLGKVKEDGETPEDCWQVADVALGIIKRQQHELEQRRRAMDAPEVREAIQQLRERAASDSMARQEQGWREGPGHGPGGRRYTGD